MGKGVNNRTKTTMFTMPRQASYWEKDGNHPRRNTHCQLYPLPCCLQTELNIICNIQQLNTAELNSNPATVSLLEQTQQSNLMATCFIDLKRCYCSVTYLALVINRAYLLQLPLLSITVANCRRKAERTQKPCCAPGIKHNMEEKKSHKCSSVVLEPTTKCRAISQNLFSCCNDPQRAEA